jgi:uncharacterized membrane protein YjjP (DUF1212 family)
MSWDDSPHPSCAAARPYPVRVAAPQQHWLSARARRAIAGQGPPTQPIGLRAYRSELDDLAAHAALELALRLGEAMLAVGAPAADVTATVLRVSAAFDMTSCQVDVTFTSLTVSYDRDDAVPLTAMRIVRTRAADYTRLQGVTDLARRVTDGTVDVETAHSELDRIVSAPHPYRRWVTTLALAGMATAVAFLLGAGWQIAVVAALTTAAIDRLQRALNQWGLPFFFQQALGAALATGVALLLQLLDVGLRSSLVVAAGIVVLLAGLSLVGAAEDAISGFQVTAVARGFEVLTLTAGIVVGIGAVLDVGRRAQLPLHLHSSSAPEAPWAVAVAASAATAACWAVAAYARPRSALVAAVAGGLSWATYSLAGQLGVGPAVASAVAGAVVGFCGEALSDRLRIPPLLVAVCGIVPLLPGLSIYRGMFAVVVDNDVSAGIATLAGAVAICLGLAAGVTLGEFLATPVRTNVDRWDRRVRRRARAARD